MNWYFWLPPAPSEACDDMHPLLSLLADGMASRAESRRARTHLATCADCRQALAWMQATHDVLAMRETVSAPADLHARCRRAWAAEESLAPLPRRAVPSPRFVRPAFAAVMSLVVVGVMVGRHFYPTPLAPVPVVTPPVRTAKPSVAAYPPTTEKRPLVGHQRPGPQMVAIKPLDEHGVVPTPKRVRDTSPTKEVALLPPAPTQEISRPTSHAKTAPALTASNPAPSPTKHAAPSSGKLMANLPKSHPELTPAVPRDNPPAQIATNKIPDMPSAPSPGEGLAQTPPAHDAAAPHVADYVPAPSHADPLGAVRLHLPSLNESGERKIAMASGVHILQASFVQSPIVYTH